MFSDGRIFEYIDIGNSRYLIAQIRPINIPVIFKEEKVFTTKWMTFAHWQQVENLIHKIVTSDEFKEKNYHKNEALQLKYGESIVIGYRFEDCKNNSACICHSPREDIVNDKRTIRAGQHFKYKSASFTLVMAVYPLKLESHDLCITRDESEFTFPEDALAKAVGISSQKSKSESSSSAELTWQKKTKVVNCDSLRTSRRKRESLFDTSSDCLSSSNPTHSEHKEEINDIGVPFGNYSYNYFDHANGLNQYFEIKESRYDIDSNGADNLFRESNPTANKLCKSSYTINRFVGDEPSVGESNSSINHLLAHDPMYYPLSGSRTHQVNGNGTAVEESKPTFDDLRPISPICDESRGNSPKSDNFKGKSPTSQHFERYSPTIDQMLSPSANNSSFKFESLKYNRYHLRERTDPVPNKNSASPVLASKHKLSKIKKNEAGKKVPKKMKVFSSFENSIDSLNEFDVETTSKLKTKPSKGSRCRKPKVTTRTSITSGRRKKDRSDKNLTAVDNVGSTCSTKSSSAVEKFPDLESIGETEPDTNLKSMLDPQEQVEDSLPDLHECILPIQVEHSSRDWQYPVSPSSEIDNSIPNLPGQYSPTPLVKYESESECYTKSVVKEDSFSNTPCSPRKSTSKKSRRKKSKSPPRKGRLASKPRLNSKDRLNKNSRKYSVDMFVETPSSSSSSSSKTYVENELLGDGKSGLKGPVERNKEEPKSTVTRKRCKRKKYSGTSDTASSSCSEKASGFSAIVRSSQRRRSTVSPGMLTRRANKHLKDGERASTVSDNAAPLLKESESKDAFLQTIIDEFRKLSEDDMKNHVKSNISHLRKVILGQKKNFRAETFKRGPNFPRDQSSYVFFDVFENNDCYEILNNFILLELGELIENTLRDLPNMFSMSVLMPEVLKKILLSMDVIRGRDIATDEQCEQVFLDIHIYTSKLENESF